MIVGISQETSRWGSGSRQSVADGRKQSPRAGFENNVLYTRQLEDKDVVQKVRAQ
jgi:hypothetical protein